MYSSEVTMTMKLKAESQIGESFLQAMMDCTHTKDVWVNKKATKEYESTSLPNKIFEHKVKGRNFEDCTDDQIQNVTDVSAIERRKNLREENFNSEGKNSENARLVNVGLQFLTRAKSMKLNELRSNEYLI